jgi:hypothetical protein
MSWIVEVWGRDIGWIVFSRHRFHWAAQRKGRGLLRLHYAVRVQSASAPGEREGR